MKLHSSNAGATRQTSETASVDRVTLDARTNAFNRVHDELDQSTDDGLEKSRMICVLESSQRTCGDHASGTITLRAMVPRHTSST